MSNGSFCRQSSMAPVGAAHMASTMAINLDGSRICSRLVVVALLVLAVVGAPPVTAQQRDSATIPTPRAGRFRGVVQSFTTMLPVTQADVRLMFIDSVHATKDSGGMEVNDYFVDSLRSKIAITDSAGAFSMHDVRSGRYLASLRRIGFEPLQVLVTLGASFVELQVAMTQLFQVLPEIRITTREMDRANAKLENVGFTGRSHEGFASKFLRRTDIVRANRTRITEVLESYGIGGGADFVVDGIPTDSAVVRDYPLDLVAGIEIYRLARPQPFNATRAQRITVPGPKGIYKPAIESSSRAGSSMAPPLVVIWTSIP